MASDGLTTHDAPLCRAHDCELRCLDLDGTAADERLALAHACQSRGESALAPRAIGRSAAFETRVSICNLQQAEPWRTTVFVRLWANQMCMGLDEGESDVDSSKTSLKAVILAFMGRT